MINLELTKNSFWQAPVEGFVLFLNEKLESATADINLDHIEKTYYPHLKEILKKHQFEGKKGQSFVLTGMKDGALLQFIFIGIGCSNKSWDRQLELLRRAIGAAVGILKKLSIKKAIIALPEEKPYNISDTELLKQMAITLHMASYEFITFKSEKKKTPWECNLLIAVNPNYDQTGFNNPLHEGNVIGNAINNARHWADLPANILTPTALSQEAEKIASKHDLKCTIFGREKALELGMGGFCAVDAGSDQDGKFVVLEYKSEVKNAPTIALCGKGIIFDTGGINLKPTAGITGMKFDMCGAAAVIALMDIFAQLKPAVNVIGLTPIVENMPSGKASRPDDIITCMNGKTVEIRNTDAEGRLVLSDTLCYAEKFYNPDIIFDIATLTGAVQHALGHFYTAVMTTDNDLADTLFKLGQSTGDRTWPLPLDEDFREAVRSDVADIHNNSSPTYFGGTITGGIFLQNFVEKARWAHLDIAGSSHEVPGINYMGKGASGAGIRLLAEFVMKHSV